MNYEKRKEVAIDALAGINPLKPFGTNLFNALARITINIAIETVTLRLGRGLDGLEILMFQRPENDHFWPNEWHCAGTILRSREKFNNAFERLVKNEFLVPLKEEPKFIGILNHNDSPRGHEVALVYLIELTGEVKKGKWFRTDQLPENTTKHHKEKIIPLAINRYSMIPIWTRISE